jgi:hypothetical protein
MMVAKNQPIWREECPAGSLGLSKHAVPVIKAALGLSALELEIACDLLEEMEAGTLQPEALRRRLSAHPAIVQWLRFCKWELAKV